MNKSIKTALLFSTLFFGAVEAPSVVSHNANTAIIAHADSTSSVNQVGDTQPTDNITPAPATGDTSTTNIQNITDPTLKSFLLTEVNNDLYSGQGQQKYTDASQITNSDLARLTKISFQGDGSQSIKSFNGISQSVFPNLQIVSIKNVSLKNAALTNFNTFTTIKVAQFTNTGLSSNPNATLGSVATIGRWVDNNLTYLDFSNNNISDLSFLNNISIPNVKHIIITNNSISDFTPVENVDWSQLQELNVSSNLIHDLSPLQNFQHQWTNLTSLNASNNQISDISPISSSTNGPGATWKNLTSINVDNNNISDINPFAQTQWSNLTTISANGNDISNVSSLKGKNNVFSKLNTFLVKNNSINDISWMAGYNFSINSFAKDQIINETVNVNKPATVGASVTVNLPETIADVSLSSPSSGYNASATPSGQSYVTVSNVPDGVTVLGNDGNPNGTVNNSSVTNGVKSVKLNYSGSGSNSLSFNFNSTLNVGVRDRFNGTYNLTINWVDPNSSNGSNTNNNGSSNSGSNTNNGGSSNSGSNTNNGGSSNSGSNTNGGTNSSDNGVINNHGNNSGKAEKTVYGKVIGTRSLNLYKKNAFTKKNKIKAYKKATGNKRPLFKVVKKVFSSINTPRYFVYQINPFTNKEIKNTRGYITAKSTYVTPLYYTSSVKAVKVSGKSVTSYKKANLKDASKKYKRGTVLKVKSVKKHGNAYSLQLQNGKFVTANKYFVVKVK
ncbi:leucine-rich repeat domain-containing protein [Apilactobacillus apinorum]|uniref:leucine-rich repeat domain-containing protein n=1 Tax=Apilactobacillus apinorum TaxID=1218495 RepID=UPI0006B439D5|nr:leucine-rich repeat domain-containing protein [Apilactobacillus apinorum]KOY68157.1 uncharacterized protein RZ74_12150 [Apilactobacillus apinorum]CAI2692764.1 Putative uncharacterized protein [Apilactobacillus apinorum]